MLRRTVHLNQITITSPCSADWDSMIGNDHVRFCRHCHLNVHNLSEMTRKEALELVRSSQGRLCARYVRRPDGTIQTSDLPAQLHGIKRRASRIAAGACTAALSLSASAAAQTASSGREPVPGSPAPAIRRSGTRSNSADGLNPSLTGTIFDPHRAVISGAKITLTNEKTKQEQTATSNDEGQYRFQSLEAGTYTLKVEAQGFALSEITNIDLQANGERRADAILQVGQVTEVTMGVVAMTVEPSEPLVKAAMDDDFAAVKELIAAGVDVNIMDKGVGTTALAEAVGHGNREMVRALLNAGADVNARTGGRQTALMRLGEHSTAGLVWDLVAAGAEVNLKDNEGDAALILAASLDNVEVLQALLAAGAKVNAKNNEGQTALMVAAREGNVDNVKALIAAGADVNKRDKDGETALKQAKDNEHADVVEVLEASGAVE